MFGKYLCNGSLDLYEILFGGQLLSCELKFKISQRSVHKRAHISCKRARARARFIANISLYASPSSQFTLYIALRSAQCTLNITFCTLQSFHFILHIVFYILHSAHLTPPIAVCTLHIPTCTLHSSDCTLLIALNFILSKFLRS